MPLSSRALAASNSEKNSQQQLAPETKTWMILDTGLSHIVPNLDGRQIAFIPEGRLGIRILSIKDGKIIEPSGRFVGPSFFWSPDGNRLFYRELSSDNGKTVSQIRAWDIVLNKNIEMDTFNGSSGLLTFDPRDNRMMLMHEKGIKTKKLLFPDNRLAFWQSSQRKDSGKWVMAQKGATFVSEGGFVMQKLKDDDSGIESFDISPDGSTAAWATRSGKIYTSLNGATAEFLDWGRDPQWHPEKNMLVYAGGRMVGNKASDFDIKIASPGTKGSFLTATQNTAERWPAWHPDGKSIFYTIDGSKELSVMKFDMTAKNENGNARNDSSERN